MRALQLIAHGAPGSFELRDMPEPKPGPDEVVVQVRACGLNRLDLWLEEAGLPIPIQLPRTPGGEIAGEVREIGANVQRRPFDEPRVPGVGRVCPQAGGAGTKGIETKFKGRAWGDAENRRGMDRLSAICIQRAEDASAQPDGALRTAAPYLREGDAVAIQSNLFCGECEFCRAGDESLCLRSQIMGVQRDGGFAEKVVVPARALVRLPAGVDFETSAALTLAGSTAMHMLTGRAQVDAGDWVLVIGGASGVGSAAIQIAKQLGARVLSTGSSAAKRALAQQLGAEFVVDSTRESWPAEVRELTNKRGVDLIVEHVGGEVLVKCFDCLGRNGTIVTCGATAGREVSLNLWPFFVKQQRLVGSYGRDRRDLEATLAWVAAGRLRPVIDSVFPLDETPAAFAKLRARQVLGKVLVKP